jgi:glycerol-3-phosphate dehydrogenase subunit C
MKEGSTQAPIRHKLDWRNPDFYDLTQIEHELERVFDICHGCRRCFNLCDSFPRLFDMVDASPSGELDGVPKSDYEKVTEACTLCDMCFMTKCPYVPPHEFNLDFPHLMLRHRAAMNKAQGGAPFVQRQLAELDRNAALARPVAGLINWATDEDNSLTRPVIEAVSGIDRHAALPQFAARTFTSHAKRHPIAADGLAPAAGRKAVIYATCSVNTLRPETGMAALAVLAKNGVQAEVAYPACCGMPYLESGDIAKVAEQAKKIALALKPYVEQGYDVIALTASCALMMKFEWPLILPDDADVMALSKATFDIDQYVVDIAKNEGLAPGLQPVEGGVTVHLACHARAQNMGPKGAEMLRLIPETKVQVIERCSGHGGTFGVMKETRPSAMKIGKPVATAAIKQASAHIVSECPLAAIHILELMKAANPEAPRPEKPAHPIEIMAKAYGFGA